jgi:uncharacterized protein YgbK (DUF1537 family)
MPLLGCIAEDFAAGAAHAFALAAEGLRCVLLIGIPASPAVDMPEDVRGADVLVIALAAGEDATERESLAALSWLRAAGCPRFCLGHGAELANSRVGAIGDALIAALGCGFAVVSPAFPSRGRSVFQGHLFLGAAPAPQANLVRVLSGQTDGTVALLPYGTVAQGAGAVRAAVTALREQGRRYAVADAVDDTHLLTLGAALGGQPLVTGSAGIAKGLAADLGGGRTAAGGDRVPDGRGAVLAGSASRATLYQIGAARAHMPVLELSAPVEATARALAWAEQQWATQSSETPLLISGAAPPGGGALAPDILADIAEGLVALGVRRMLVAGEATSLAIVGRLSVQRLHVGPEIAPGVPWCLGVRADAPQDLLLAFSDGTSAERYLFIKAFEVLRET